MSLFIEGLQWMLRLLFSSVRNVTSVSMFTSRLDCYFRLSSSYHCFLLCIWKHIFMTIIIVWQLRVTMDNDALKHKSTHPDLVRFPYPLTLESKWVGKPDPAYFLTCVWFDKYNPKMGGPLLRRALRGSNVHANLDLRRRHRGLPGCPGSLHILQVANN